MGMFGKSENVEQEMKKIESEAISSIIDKSMTITGEVAFKGKARIDGTINGNIDGEHLILSETGKVNGDITVSSFNCYGALEGNIKAGMLTARKDCSIHGKLEAASLTVEPGASIQGEIYAAAKESVPANKPQPQKIKTDTK
ncbi:MAG: cytoskeletal protein CcmA (bactofilin family) [Desulforhopalus sp.]|jgi:cytoskeletal protein CcmA (bactofilin family)